MEYVIEATKTNAVIRNNDIYKVQMHLMGHSDIGVTLNVYKQLGLEDAAAEMARMV